MKYKAFIVGFILFPSMAISANPTVYFDVPAKKYVTSAPKTWETAGLTLGLTVDQVRAWATQNGYEVESDSNIWDMCDSSQKTGASYCLRVGGQSQFVSSEYYSKENDRVFVKYLSPADSGKSYSLERSISSKKELDRPEIAKELERKYGPPSRGVTIDKSKDYCLFSTADQLLKQKAI